MEKKSRILLIAAATLVLPYTASAQSTQPAQPAQAAEPTQEAAAVPTPEEVAQLRQRFTALQRRAVEDPAIKSANEAFGAEVLAAMERLDATAAGKKARADAIAGEVEAARAASDNARINALAEEARTLQAFFSELRTRALALPEIEEKRQAYVQLLFAEMTELDPEAPRIAERLEAARAAGVQAPQAGSAPR